MIIEKKKAIADKLGLEEEEIFDCFYRVLNEDLTSYGGFSNNFGKSIEAPDWNPNPKVLRKGIHFVYGHPLAAFEYVEKKNPRFFRIPEKQIENMVPYKILFPDLFKAKGYIFYSNDELNNDSPEFNQKILAKIAKLEVIERPKTLPIKLAAISMLKDQRVLYEIAREIYRNPSRPEKKDSYLIKESAMNKLNQNYLSEIAMMDKDPDVRIIAANRITDMNFLRRILDEEDNHYVKKAVENRIKSL